MLVDKEIGLLTLTRDGIIRFVRTLSIGTITLLAADKLSEAVGLIPVVGWLFGVVTGPLSAYCMYQILTSYLEKCIEVRSKIQDMTSLKLRYPNTASESSQEPTNNCNTTVIPPESINKL